MTGTDGTTAGERFVTALAGKDTRALRDLFAADVSFRGMTPGRFWEATTPDALITDVLYEWFEPADVIEAVLAVETGRVGPRRRVDYRLRVRNPDGLHEVEQRAYYDLDDSGRIRRMHAVCAGFQPLDA